LCPPTAEHSTVDGLLWEAAVAASFDASDNSFLQHSFDFVGFVGLKATGRAVMIYVLHMCFVNIWKQALM
jgi:hypothetical protein